jgi:inosine-uridine nucleoside N-ribohydrolase
MPRPRPVVIDTDLGNDIDDSWALAMALRCPDIDVRLVVTSTGEPAYRAALTADLLAAADAAHVPIGLGLPGHSNPEQPLASLADPQVLAAHQGGVRDDGVAALVEAVEAAATTGEVTVIALGPLTTVAAAIDRRPDVMARARLVGMHGSLRVGYWGTPQPMVEYNVTMDVEAARRVFGAPWSCTVTPLDTCGSVRLEGERYRAVYEAAESDPLLGALMRQQRAWLDRRGQPELFERETTVLYDTVAVHLAYDESLVDIEELGIGLSPYGLMSISAEDPTLRLATQWRDQDRFLDHLVDCLLGRASATNEGG